MLKEVEELKQRIGICFVPETIEYLKRGGRIGLMKSTIASVLGIKPVLHFKLGKLESKKKGIGMAKAIVEMVNDLPSNIKRLYVVYIHEAPKHLESLVAKIKEKYNIEVKTTQAIGPVIGSHIGVGALGVAYLADK